MPFRATDSSGALPPASQRIPLPSALAVLILACVVGGPALSSSTGDTTMTRSDASFLESHRRAMRLTLDPRSSVMQVFDGEVEWRMHGAGMAGFAHLTDSDGHTYILGGAPGASQNHVPITWEGAGRFRIVGKGSLSPLDATAEIVYALEKNRRLRCTIVLAGLDVPKVQHVRFPFAPSVDSPSSRLVFPQWLGLLASPDGEDFRVTRRLYERPWCMRFFGATQNGPDQGGSAYIAVVEDSLYRLVDVWRREGRAGYDLYGERSWAEGRSERREQTITFEFLDGNYVDIAHRYRARMLKRPEWRTLATRERPCDPQRVGGAVVFGHVPCDYGGEPIPFEDFIPRLRALKEAGLERAIIHLGGWNRLGYDSEYPDVFPANPKCGGDEGMRKLTGVIDELGYLCTPHDDLGIVSTQAPSYDLKWAAHGADGRPINGGIYREQQYYLASGAAQLHFANRNMPEVAARYPRVRGYLFDVTTSVRPIEDYSESPPVPKAEDLARRNAMFAVARREFAEFITAESIMDWAIESLDSAYMAEEGYCHRGDGGWVKDALHGEIVPIWELVYHDAMIGMRESTTHVNTPMDTEDPLMRYLRVFLKTLRAGTVPPAFYSDDLRLGVLDSYIKGSQADCGGWSQLDKMQMLATVSRLSTWLADNVFTAPMTGHAFPDANLFHEQTSFEGKAGETIVYVNSDSEKPWSPQPGLVLAPLGFWIAGPDLQAYHALEVAGQRFDVPTLAAFHGKCCHGGGIEVFRAFGPETLVVPLEKGDSGVVIAPKAVCTVSTRID